MAKALVSDTKTVKVAKQVVEWSRNACFSAEQPVRTSCSHARREEYDQCVLFTSVCKDYLDPKNEIMTVFASNLLAPSTSPFSARQRILRCSLCAPLVFGMGIMYLLIVC
jgi:hypothetical protein